MAQGISSAFVTLFDAEVKQAYQGQRLLAGLVRERQNVEGSTVKFPKIGKGSATLLCHTSGSSDGCNTTQHHIFAGHCDDERLQCC